MTGLAQRHEAFAISLKNGVLALGAAPVVMGIVNVTPDSFSDGGDNASPKTALAHAQRMVAEGADLIDIGGESTRPGAEPVTVQQELDRVMPVFDALRETAFETPVSIDTRHALVADQAIQAGAQIVNDVEGLQADPDMASVIATHKVPAILMHWDRDRDRSLDVMGEMRRFFARSLDIAAKAGIAEEAIILDPGFGFAKDLAENYEILRRLDELAALGRPLLAGTSRKSMIGKLLGNDPKERVFGTVATSVLAYERGAHVFRVHDVAANRDGLRVAAACLYAPPDRQS